MNFQNTKFISRNSARVTFGTLTNARSLQIGVIQQIGPDTFVSISSALIEAAIYNPAV